MVAQARVEEYFSAHKLVLNAGKNTRVVFSVMDLDGINKGVDENNIKLLSVNLDPKVLWRPHLDALGI